MNRTHGYLLVFFAGSLLAAATAEEAVSAAALLDEVIPKVAADYGRGRQVLGAEVRSLILPQLQAMLGTDQSVSAEAVRAWAHQIVNGIVNQRLLLEEARRNGVKVDLARGRELVAEQSGRFGETMFARLLQLQGVTAEEMAAHLAENDAVNRWIEETVAAGITVTEAETRAYYEGHPEEFPEVGEYHVHHILIAASLSTAYEDLGKARDKAERVLREIQGGTPFAEAARTHSSCPSKADGGDLGFLPVGRMPAAFEEVATTLGPGRLSEVLRSPMGYHIILGGECRASGTKPYEKVREDLHRALRLGRLDAAMRELKTRLREAADVHIYIPEP
ncbi:MAG: peptidylprolyl isomerase [Lentisphaeria bacterium]|nr:peptidylprolyl isomerase [Lentisphaeria bacterium]